jgi:hypothetical protein
MIKCGKKEKHTRRKQAKSTHDKQIMYRKQPFLIHDKTQEI